MLDINKISNECDNNLENIIQKSSTDISSWFNSEFKKFEHGNPDYDIFIKTLQSANQLFIENLNTYHTWLTDNFIVSPKNE